MSHSSRVSTRSRGMDAIARCSVSARDCPLVLALVVEPKLASDVTFSRSTPQKRWPKSAGRSQSVRTVMRFRGCTGGVAPRRRDGGPRSVSSGPRPARAASANRRGCAAARRPADGKTFVVDVVRRPPSQPSRRKPKISLRMSADARWCSRAARADGSAASSTASVSVLSVWRRRAAARALGPAWAPVRLERPSARAPCQSASSRAAWHCDSAVTQSSRSSASLISSRPRPSRALAGVAAPIDVLPHHLCLKEVVVTRVHNVGVGVTALFRRLSRTRCASVRYRCECSGRLVLTHSYDCASTAPRRASVSRPLVVRHAPARRL